MGSGRIRISDWRAERFGETVRECKIRDASMLKFRDLTVYAELDEISFRTTVSAVLA